MSQSHDNPWPPGVGEGASIAKEYRAKPPLSRLTFWLHVAHNRGARIAKFIDTDPSQCPWDDLGFALVEAESALDECAALIDGDGGAPIDRPSTRLRGQMGKVSTIFGIYQRAAFGPPTALPKDWPARISVLKKWTDRLRALKPEPTPAIALSVLAKRESWRLNALPEGVGIDILQVLDADGLIEVRPWLLQNHTTDPRNPLPLVPEPWHLDWVSPVAKPMMAGTWPHIFAAAKAEPRTAVEVRVSGRGRAELARSMLKGKPGSARPKKKAQRKSRKLSRPTKADSDPFQPASYFGKKLGGRIRQAAVKVRKTKRVRKKVIQGVVCYSVNDVRQWWERDFLDRE